MKKRELTLALTLLLILPLISSFTFCSNGEQSADTIKVYDISDMSDGDDWKWYALDEIELETRVENLGTEQDTFILEIVFEKNEEEIEITKDSLTKEITLDPNDRENIIFNFDIKNDIKSGNYNLHIKLYEKSHEDEHCTEINQQIEIKSLNICPNENIEENLLEIDSISDKLNDNEIKWQWSPLNRVSVEFNTENKNYTDSNFVAELIFLDENKNEIEIATKELKQDIELKLDEKTKITFDFTVSEEVKKGTYDLYAKVYQKNNEERCTSLRAEDKNDYEKISIDLFDHNVIISSVEGQKEIYAGQDVSYKVKVSNIGNKIEPKVRILAYNYMLDLRLTKEIANLSPQTSKEVLMNFTIPKNVTNCTRKIWFSTEFDYREDSKVYKKFSLEEDDIKYIVKLISVPIKENINTVENNTKNKTQIKNETSKENKTTNITSSKIEDSEDKTSKKSSFKTIIIAIFMSLVMIAGVLKLLIIIQEKQYKKKTYLGTEGMEVRSDL